ncbi:alpha-tocopherol transfer protein-like [Folsomia candida]|nr:alpha-tocopherol transfer protein-like [Folsomia candida]
MQEANHNKILDQLKDEIKENSKLSPFSEVLDDKFLIGFLRGKKYKVDDTIKCLEHFIRMRCVKYKYIINSFSPSTAIMVNKGVFNILKEKDPLGRVVGVAHVNAWDTSQVSIEDAIATTVFFMDEGIRSVFPTCNEIVLIFDLKGFSFDQARRLTPRMCILAIEMFFKCLPCRPKAMHLVNENLLLHGVLRFFKPLLDKKLQDRIYIHSNHLDRLHEHVPPAILPECLGGMLSKEESYDREIVTLIKDQDAINSDDSLSYITDPDSVSVYEVNSVSASTSQLIQNDDVTDKNKRTYDEENLSRSTASSTGNGLWKRFRGVICILLGSVLFSMVTLFVKMLAEMGVEPYEASFWR